MVLVFIIITPTAFGKLYEAQDALLTDHVISNFILGTEDRALGGREYKIAEECTELSYAETDGDYISILVLKPFLQVEHAREIQSGDLLDYCSIGIAGSLNKGTASQYLTSTIVNYAPRGENDLYVVDYRFFISSLVGIVVTLILVSFCFDVAVRSIKLGFLQLIAPIPIMSYEDPKSGKDGMFKKWLKEVFKTWADLFIRLAALFFAVYIIKLLSNEDIFANVQEYKIWVMLFILIGALIFAKKFPSLLGDLLGIKLDGGLTLNPMKKIRDNALGGKAVTGALKGTAAVGAGFALGSAVNMAALGSNVLSSVRSDGWKTGLKKSLAGDSKGLKGFARGLGKAGGIIGGGVSSALHGGYGAFKNDSLKKGVMPGLKQSVDNRDLRDKRQDMGYGFSIRMTDKARAVAGIKTTAKKRSEQIESRISRLQASQTNISHNQQTYMSSIDATNMDKLSSVSYDNKKGTYSLADEKGNKLAIKGKTEWDRTEFENLLHTGDLGTAVTSRNLDAAMKYVDLQAQRNALDKQIFGLMKQQKALSTEDTKAKQGK